MVRFRNVNIKSCNLRSDNPPASKAKHKQLCLYLYLSIVLHNPYLSKVNNVKVKYLKKAGGAFFKYLTLTLFTLDKYGLCKTIDRYNPYLSSK